MWNPFNLETHALQFWEIFLNYSIMVSSLLCSLFILSGTHIVLVLDLLDQASNFIIFSFLFLSFYSDIWKVSVFLFSSLSSEFLKFLLASFLNSKIFLRKIMNAPLTFLNSILTLPHAYNIPYLMMIFHTILSFWNPLKGWCLWSSLAVNFHDHLQFVRQSLLQNLS